MAIIKPLLGVTPEIGPDVFLAENVVIIGQVSIGARSSLWYNVVLRGDVNWITVGEESNIQDGSVVHCTYQESPTVIGDRVTIGHAAVVHGCTLQSDCLVGMHATVMDKAVVESDCIIAAGALVREGMVCESGYLYAGVPAKRVKPLSPEQIEGIRYYASQYRMYAGWYTSAES